MSCWNISYSLLYIFTYYTSQENQILVNVAHAYEIVRRSTRQLEKLENKRIFYGNLVIFTILDPLTATYRNKLIGFSY